MNGALLKDYDLSDLKIYKGKPFFRFPNRRSIPINQTLPETNLHRKNARCAALRSILLCP
jgi:hypothetical protein